MGVEKLVHECLWIVVQYFLFGHGCLIMGVLYILILDITAGVQKTQTHTHTQGWCTRTELPTDKT